MIQVKIHPHDESILTVQFKPIPFYLERIRQVADAKFEPDEKCWHIPRFTLPDLEGLTDGEIIYNTPRHEILNEQEPPAPEYYKDIPEHEIPTTLSLYSFQKFGSNFLAHNALEVGFGLLCDKMGSGKTCQSLGAAELLRNEGHIKNKILVVCKKALKTQWKTEGVEKFTNKSAIVIDGTPAQRKKQYKEAQSKDYVVINYETLRNKSDSAILNKMQFDLIIIDEAHKAKNVETKTNQALSKFAQDQGAMGFILTGTPIMNRPEELYGLFSIFNPDYLGSWSEFQKKYLVYAFNGKFQERVGIKKKPELETLTQPYMLRRGEKELGIELPKLVQREKLIEPTKAQKLLHETCSGYLEEAREKMAQSQTPEEQKKFTNQMQGFMQMLIAVADSTELLKLSDSGMAKKLLELAQKEKDWEVTPKLDMLLSDIEDIVEADEKVVIFTSFKRMAEYIGGEIEKKAKQKVLYIHGQINQQTRDNAKDLFWNSDDHKILIGTDAMAEGWT